jgi:DNA-binding NarL/FixJ family response regulator
LNSTEQALLSLEAAMAMSVSPSDGVLRLGLVCADPVRVIGLTAILTEQRKVEIIPLSGRGALQESKCSIELIDSTSTHYLFQLLETFQRAYPQLRLIVIGLEEDTEHVQLVIRAGAKGYLSHTARESEILMAVDVVADGSMWAPRKVMAKLLEKAAAGWNAPPKGREAKLTWREEEVLHLLTAGQPNRVIAETMGIDEVTVKGHVGRLMRKMGVTNRISLSLHAKNGYMNENKVDAAWKERRVVAKERRRLLTQE